MEYSSVIKFLKEHLRVFHILLKVALFDCHDILGYNSCYTNSREYLDRTSYMNPSVKL